MPLPGFTAVSSCDRIAGVFTARSRGAAPAHDQAAVVPAQYVCDQYAGGTVCTCDGLDNCIQMFETGTCSAVAMCDASLGAGHPVCGCIAN